MGRGIFGFNVPDYFIIFYVSISMDMYIKQGGMKIFSSMHFMLGIGVFIPVINGIFYCLAI